MKRLTIAYIKIWNLLIGELYYTLLLNLFFFFFFFLQIDCIEDLKIEKKDKTEVCFRPPIYIVSYLSLPNNIWRLIVFAPFLIIIIIIIVLVLVILLSFRAP
jgi:hypothetical protein